MGWGYPPKRPKYPPPTVWGYPPPRGGIPPPTQNTPNLAIISLKGCLPCLYRAKGGFRLMDPQKVTFPEEIPEETRLLEGGDLDYLKGGFGTQK